MLLVLLLVLWFCACFVCGAARERFSVQHAMGEKKTSWGVEREGEAGPAQFARFPRIAARKQFESGLWEMSTFVPPNGLPKD